MVCFLTFIMFVLFAVLNVMTGVFCQNAIENAQRNDELKKHILMTNKKAYIEKMKSLFSDENGEPENVSFYKLDRLFEDRKMQSFFSALEIDVSDPWMLFKLLDTDGSRTIDI